MKKQTIELLAPAGSWEALEAAVNAGADAVYMGGKAFGARQYASNFDREEMQKAVYFAHMHRVRLYITVNTLVDDSELGELADYLLFLSNVGIDGIIVQDLGVIRAAGHDPLRKGSRRCPQSRDTPEAGRAEIRAAGRLRQIRAV